MRDPELNSIGDCLIGFGFTCKNEEGHKFRFWLDDIEIVHRGFMWIIDDTANGPVEYFTLKEILENEFFRWEDE